MPSAALAKLIMKKKPIHESWLEMAEERRELIKPFLSRFTLKRLGSMICLNNGSSYVYHSIESDEPFVTAEEGLSLDTQGIWDPNLGSYKSDPARSYKWGLNRAGKWVLVTLFYTWDDNHFKKAYAVQMYHVGLPDLLVATGVTAYTVWKALGSTVHTWAHEHKKIHESIQGLDDTFEEESTILNWLASTR